MFDFAIGRETDGPGNNEICLGVRFALCIIKAQRLARIEHYGGHPLSPSFTVSFKGIFPLLNAFESSKFL